jgi:hypothetical protein
VEIGSISTVSEVEFADRKSGEAASSNGGYDATGTSEFYCWAGQLTILTAVLQPVKTRWSVNELRGELI